MVNSKKFFSGAAGSAGGGAALNVEDVFSSYLYDGNGSTQVIENNIALGGFGVGTSTKFNKLDSDYLSRSSDLSGNTDSNSFTFSVWLKFDNLNGYRIYQVSDGSNGRFIIYPINSSIIQIKGYNSSGSTLMDGDLSYSLATNVWYHILISIDLSSTSNRKVYINDVDVSSSVSWGTYTNGNIDFTNSIHEVSTDRHGGSYYDGNMAHLFLDYTYRNLATTSNRRLFIDADGGSTPPSTLSALSPIIYLPMTDGYSIGENLGTGGDFTSNNSPTIVSEGTEYDADVAKGGMTWIKLRNSASNNELYDTERGATYSICTNTTNAAITRTTSLTSFNSNGFILGSGTNVNANNYTAASWTFRKAPKFFDVQTWTGNATSGREISHNLGTTVGCVMIKNLSRAENWMVYHIGSGIDGQLNLNSTAAATDDSTQFNDTVPTSTTLYLGSNAEVNFNGDDYVAYLFAHNNGDGEFGPDGDQDIIKCGTCSGETGSNRDIDLGFEPQFIITKAVDTTGDWRLLDNMRGWLANPKVDSTYLNNRLEPNTSDAESSDDTVYIKPNGFYVNGLPGSGDYIYIAIRRGPMAVPEDADDVFATGLYTGDGTNNRILSNSITADSVFSFYRGSGFGKYAYDRLRGDERWLDTTTTSAESNSLGGSTGRGYNLTKHQTDLQLGLDDSNWFNINGDSYGFRNWKRAHNFFDVVTYTGNGFTQNINHNLGVAPEMIWVKQRDATRDWGVYHAGLSSPSNTYLLLNGTNAVSATNNDIWNNTAPTDSVFSVGVDGNTNMSGGDYIAYLFASLDGVSKVGSFSHTNGGGDTNVDCGFSSGARFVLYKQYDSSGSWYVLDSTRGIVAGNDPALLLNSTAAEDSSYDQIDPYSSGFTIPSDGVGTGDYIFYAIA